MEHFTWFCNKINRGMTIYYINLVMVIVILQKLILGKLYINIEKIWL